MRQRVNDWADRIEGLYEAVEGWLPTGWMARRGLPVTMNEELMQNMSVPARELPTLDLLHDGTAEVRIRPYGLWIIGANGRIDLVKGRNIFLILDHAKTFESPNWHIAPAIDRQNSKPFDRSQLEALVSA